MLRQYFLLISILLLGLGLQAQTYLFTADSVLLATIDNGTYYSGYDNSVIYNVQGNLIFNGATQNKDSIAFMVDSKGDVFKNAKTEFLSADGKEQLMTIRKGDYRLGKSHFIGGDDRIGFMQKDDEVLNIMNDPEGEVLATVSSTELSAAEMVLAFHIAANYLGMVDAAKQRTQAPAQGQLPNGAVGIIKPYWGDPNLEWVWDGKMLKPRYSNDMYYYWEFDGQHVEPYFMSEPKEEWLWENGTLSPYWGSNLEKEYIWDGTELQPKWNNDYMLEYEYANGIFEPKWDNDPSRKWVIQGTVPMPLVALVIYGYVWR